MNYIQFLIDKGNLVDYTSPVIVTGKRPDIEDIPDYAIEDCKRIVSLFDNEISLDMAYDLWHIHSEYSFCGSWENMDCISDEVIIHNLMGLIKWIEFSSDI